MDDMVWLVWYIMMRVVSREEEEACFSFFGFKKTIHIGYKAHPTARQLHCSGSVYLPRLGGEGLIVKMGEILLV